MRLGGACSPAGGDPLTGLQFFLIKKTGGLFAAAAVSAVRAVEGRVERIEVFGIQIILNHPQRLAEPLEVDDLPFTEETDGITDLRILDQTEDVVVSESCFLLWCDLVRTTCKE